MEELNKQQKKNKPVRKRKTLNYRKILIVIAFVVYIAVMVIAAWLDATPVVGTVTLSEIYEMADRGEIESINVTNDSNAMYINKTDGTTVDAVNPQNDTFIYDLMEYGINVEIQEASMFDSVMEIVLTLPMTIIMVIFIVYLSNTIVGGSTKMFTILKKELNHVTFEDIKGLGKTKEEVQFIISQLKNWKELGELGARPCKGALLYGPPGTGKTMLARAIAKEAGVAFISASGSDFNEVFVGVGAARVRSLWDLAMLNAPCVLFIDEIDCLGKRRKGGDGASNDHNQTLNALLQRMDGLNEANGIMVIGATNRKEDLDPALLRPGRFDRHYYVGAPDNKKDRDEIVEIYLKNKKLDEAVTIEKASKLMVGLTGAEIEQTMNEAVYISLQDNRKGVIKLSDIDEAVMKLHTGGVVKEHTAKRDMQITAIHEAGHTIVSLLEDIEIAKVSIVAYSSGVGGVTVRDMDRTGDIKLKLKSEYEKEIRILLAGKVAEEIKYGEHTQGCVNDIEKATELIYRMVTSYGFDNEALFNINKLEDNGIQNALKNDIIEKCNKELKLYNEQTEKMLREHIEKLDKLVDRLYEEKTIVSPSLDMLS